MIPAIVDTALTQTTASTRATKATKRQQVSVAKKTTKKSWFVSEEAVRRVGVHATMENRSESDVVSEALEALNRWNLPAANNRASKGTKPAADTEEDRKEIQAA